MFRGNATCSYFNGKETNICKSTSMVSAKIIKTTHYLVKQSVQWSIHEYKQREDEVVPLLLLIMVNI